MADKVYVLTITDKGKKGYVLLPEAGTITSEQLQSIVNQVILAVPGSGSGGNMDGGTPCSDYGGTSNIDSGGV